MDLSPFLQEIEPAAPSGSDLRNEPAFHAIERMQQPAARNVRIDRDGGPPSDADVDWAELFEAATELAGKGRDLRLLVIVVRAMTNQDGLAGLATGLDFLTQSLTDFWDSLHPELRERDDPKDAALRRINALKQLENDDNGLLGDLEMNAIMRLPGLGIITGQNLCDASRSDFEAANEAPSGLSDAEMANMRAAHEANQNRVTAACRAMATEDPDTAAALQADVAAASAALNKLQSSFSTLAGLGNGTGITFPELTQFLDRATAMMEQGMVKMDENLTSQAPPDQPNVTTTSAPAPSSAPGTVQSRHDVEHYLAEIISFYERTEPSSPLPHLARRMQRMVHMDFMELMNEIAPSGIKEFRNVAGVAEEKRK
ncbi:type VI secretion system protein TssA [Yoonia sediminilitoris]|uniref:Type VI secretion system protein ImpA n=1 Tax=Yoonia sediminilitoris TaxID=1286148 RepID=A0A2T6KM23_9RHOB|nr:type VI secretion system protein TssA [Yoonia sediminilitoris]PUB17269.1 type VI secretion system protein ImpA [Yoonia sediminilitoris]RCW97564.1 type VI secretion system protein ImpA [Yoonia sediminilitoris]